jgi:murein L,D-transpeptidase YafK
LFRFIGYCLFVLSLSASGEISPTQASRIAIVKSTHTMTLSNDDKVLRKYNVALGRSPKGPKEHQGDHKTPESEYVVDSKNSHSRFHLALHPSDPNADDRAQAARNYADPGGMVEIHGLPPYFAFVGSFQSSIDWTDGCIAVSNAEIEEIWKLEPVGTKVEILP